MGYSVHIFRREVQARRAASDDPGFFEKEANLLPLKAADVERLEGELTMRGWVEGAPQKQRRLFTNEVLGATALLTQSGLYLSASGEDATFDILMLASEIADDELAKYDPQVGEWE